MLLKKCVIINLMLKEGLNDMVVFTTDAHGFIAGLKQYLIFCLLKWFIQIELLFSIIEKNFS